MCTPTEKTQPRARGIHTPLSASICHDFFRSIALGRAFRLRGGIVTSSLTNDCTCARHNRDNSATCSGYPTSTKRSIYDPDRATDQPTLVVPLGLARAGKSGSPFRSASAAQERFSRRFSRKRRGKDMRYLPLRISRFSLTFDQQLSSAHRTPQLRELGHVPGL